MKPSGANSITIINHPEALISGGGNLRGIMGLASNPNYLPYADTARNSSGANIQELNTILSSRGNQ